VSGFQQLLIAVGLLVALAGFGGNALAQNSHTHETPIAPKEVVDAAGVRMSVDDATVEPARLISSQTDDRFSPAKLKELMRPTFDFGAEWYGESDDVELATYKTKVKIPTYPIFGPPPPFLSAGFGYTDLNAPSVFDLPSELYEYSVGLAWMRRRNERWMFRSMIGVANATDGNNNTSDAWQFRGGVFAMYSPSEQWTWTFGAIALGRNDIPVVPAIGLIYQPNPTLRFDLAFPRPRASFLLTDNGQRQHWGYIGAGLNGGTWAYQRNSGTNDQLTYRAWQLVLGWESKPRPEPGMPFTRGRKFGAEIGYAFAREFEFETEVADIQLGDTIILRATMSF
jgi:hypothetical protein